ncbi:MAG: hypothetical protein A3C35_04305 [Omnitrophica bacterium RIFCSPHIGHO2_02_FULL_46_11]|nr:MAG: hypothetical protein A3A81_07420 [Omnitrophica bacterium RIFCSPLOWO2_01_FULL_45_10b]OGW87515.1 MAG: hypothetical protein A3C35_04305 [Omnitrophica bacterium RIFCSPHIGHO2_02_FULL_46_11]
MKQYSPKIGKNVFIHPSATVIGQVTLKDYANIWPGSVLRGDLSPIVVGKYSNIQDLSVMHIESDRGCFVGDYCVVGHRVILHACTVGDGVLVGMGAVILNGSRIGDGALIGAGALVTEGTKVKSESLYLGAPARFVRRLSKREVRETIEWAKKYAQMAEAHRNGMYLQAPSHCEASIAGRGNL